MNCGTACRVNTNRVPEMDADKLHADLSELKMRRVVFPTP